MAALPTIHMFWHGAPLTRIERLAMASFAAQGHAVELHVYDEPASVPQGVTLRDASQVLPRAALFTHRRTGSLGPFADWFRYRLLHARGGIWADTDVVCLRPLTDLGPLAFGWETAQFLNTAVLGLPAGHALAAWMASACQSPNVVHPYDPASKRLRKFVRRRLRGDRRDDIRWGEYGPKGFTAAVQHFGLIQEAQPIECFYPIPCERWQQAFEPVGPNAPAIATADPITRLPSVSLTVHLWHAMMHREPGFEKNGRFAADSLFETLWRRYCGPDAN